jgi:hypothetical protein
MGITLEFILLATSTLLLIADFRSGHIHYLRWLKRYYDQLTWVTGLDYEPSTISKEVAPVKYWGTFVFIAACASTLSFITLYGERAFILSE